MTSLRLSLIMTLALGLTVGCGDDGGSGTPDGSLPDGGADTSMPDGSVPDGSIPDGSTPDGSIPDGSAPDAMIPADLLGASAEASATALTEFCTCIFAEEGYDTAAACVADNGPSEVDASCLAAGYAAGDVEAFFFCQYNATLEFNTCMAAAACDGAASGACSTAQETAQDACPVPPMDAATAFTTASDACYTDMVVGAAGGCPDSDATTMAVGASVFTGTTLLQGDDAEGTCGETGAPEVQLQWTAPSDGDFVIDTLGSAFDTTLYVLSACAGTELACNDDEAVTDTLQSRVTLTATMGTEYIIVVDGFDNGEGGDYIVNITAPAAPAP